MAFLLACDFPPGDCLTHTLSDHVAGIGHDPRVLESLLAYGLAVFLVVLFIAAARHHEVMRFPARDRD